MQDISELYKGYEDKVIDGRRLGSEIEAEVKRGVEALTERGVQPALATILVGEHPPSKLYVKLKHWACKRVGIRSIDHKLPEDTTQGELLSLISELNADEEVHGILVQMPLPEHIEPTAIMGAISQSKDVDGFHPYNMGRLVQGDESGFVPCTPKGIMIALDRYGIDVQGRNAVVVGHSTIVGKPTAAMLLNRNATLSVCHVYTQNLAAYTTQADILVVATGVKGLIKGDMVKKGAVVFDVGITWIDDRVYGDVEFSEVVERARLVSPVPGGVGPLTIAVLMAHTLRAASLKG